mmetsp:Transcript_46384/g.110472  ORF Transcript_46384/g.110472 Transcript_46384/m.110472 type:complete len:611 (-) Transcript_46384:105-1937(-)
MGIDTIEAERDFASLKSMLATADMDLEVWADSQAQILQRVTEDIGFLQRSMASLRQQVGPLAPQPLFEPTMKGPAPILDRGEFNKPKELTGDTLLPVAEAYSDQAPPEDSRMFATGTFAAEAVQAGVRPACSLEANNSYSVVGTSQATTTQVAPHGHALHTSGVSQKDVVDLIQRLADVKAEADNSDKMGVTRSAAVSHSTYRKEPKRTGTIADLVSSNRFEQLVGFVIILNAIFIAVPLDIAVRRPNDDIPVSLQAIQVAFVAFYAAELALKLYVHHHWFFVNREWRWNVLDFTLVTLSLIDLMLQHTGAAPNVTNDGFSVTFVRILRCARLSKMFRLFHALLIFRELRVMLNSISASLRSLLWSIVMIAVFYFIFAIVFLNATVSYMKSADPDDAKTEQILQLYGSLSDCMLTLYMASMGGADWGDLGEPLKKVGMPYYYLFLFYIAFMLLAVLNIVTGIFVDTAIRASEGGPPELMCARIEDDASFEKQLRIFFAEMTARAVDRRLRKVDFCKHMQDGVHRAYLGMFGIDIGDATEFFELMCCYAGNDTGILDERGFIQACARFRENAKHSDIVLLRRYAKDFGTRLIAMEKVLVGVDDALGHLVAA